MIRSPALKPMRGRYEVNATTYATNHPYYFTFNKRGYGCRPALGHPARIRRKDAVRAGIRLGSSPATRTDSR